MVWRQEEAEAEEEEEEEEERRNRCEGTSRSGRLCGEANARGWNSFGSALVWEKPLSWHPLAYSSFSANSSQASTRQLRAATGSHGRVLGKHWEFQAWISGSVSRCAWTVLRRCIDCAQFGTEGGAEDKKMLNCCWPCLRRCDICPSQQRPRDPLRDFRLLAWLTCPRLSPGPPLSTATAL